MIYDERVLTVKELTQLLKDTIETFGYVRVEGEVSNFKISQLHHWYFDLRDGNCSIAIVVFRSDTIWINYRPKNGDRVVVRGKLTVYEPRSQYQIVADRIERVGIGQLREAVEKLKEKLLKEGLFDPAHKKPLPLFPRRIGIVTSPRGAAIMDIIRTVKRRNSNVHLILYPVKVQGEGAALEIAHAIEVFNRWGQVDVIIVGRGGGSFEDLMAFNEEIVARAIFASKIPIISAVGHEVDFTISDLVADVRAATPTAAAELVVKTRESLEEKIFHLTRTLQTLVKARISEAKNRFFSNENRFMSIRNSFLNQLRYYEVLYERLLNSVNSLLRKRASRIEFLIRRLITMYPSRRIRKFIEELRSRMRVALVGLLRAKEKAFADKIQRLTKCSPQERFLRLSYQTQILEKHLVMGMVERLKEEKNRFFQLESSLQMLSPYKVLERGYAIVFKNGKVVKDTGDLQVGESVRVKLSKGQFSALVENKEN